MERVNIQTQDRRFQKTESLIRQAIESYYSDNCSTDISVKYLCQYAQITRSTFYRHYPNANAAVTAYHEYAQNELLGIFLSDSCMTKSLVAKFYRVLFHIYQCAKQKYLTVQISQFESFQTITTKIRPLVYGVWRNKYPNLLPIERRQLFTVFSYILLCEIDFWYRFEKFNLNYLFVHARRLNWLITYLPLRRNDPLLPRANQDSLVLPQGKNGGLPMFSFNQVSKKQYSGRN